MKEKAIRTRFAPSPTGYMHVGGIRTALFAFLLARQNDGQFILRLEDTDKKREVVGSDEHLIKCLKTMRLDYDEGPDIGGPFKPYRQSERLEIYQKWAQRLLDTGRAYIDPYTSEEVDGFRKQSQANNKPFLYRDYRPDVLSSDWNVNKALRFKSEPKAYAWHDEVMGDLKAGEEAVDDIILIKADGYPTYNFAHIVDDMEMEISHIIRGQEFLASMPNYLNIYEALNIKHPLFATVPHILNPTGNKKLGKRDGAKDVLEYVKDGFLVETMVNFIASLGWNDGTEQEIFSIDELIAKFNLNQVQKSGARFDEKRLIWMNGQWIRKISLDDLYMRCQNFWPDSATQADESYKKRVLEIAQDRLKTLADLPDLTSYFFEEPEINLELIKTDKKLGKLDPTDMVKMLEVVIKKLDSSNFDENELQNQLNELLTELNSKPAILFSLIRISVSWASFSPNLNQTLSVLGREKTLDRLNRSLEAIKAQD